MTDQTRRTSSLTERAADYFGWADKPRRSIRLNNEECLIVSSEVYGKAAIVMHYSERYGQPRGDFVKVTDRARAALIDALEQTR